MFRPGRQNMTEPAVPTVDYAHPSAPIAPAARGPENVRRLIAILIAILLIGLGLRLYKSGERSLWWDEGASLKWASMPPGEMIQQSRSQDTNPPAYHLILHYWTGVFGNSEVAMRML